MPDGSDVGGVPLGFALGEKAELEYWFHRARSRPGCARLDKGEPDFPPHPDIADAALRLIRSHGVKYSSGLPALKRALAEGLGARLGVEYDPATEVCVTHGATGGLFASCAVLGGRVGAIAIPAVSWPTYRLLIEHAGATVVEYPLPGWSADGEERWPRGIRALLVNSPHNPTGSVLTVDALATLAATADAEDGWVISDEAYEALAFAAHPHVSIASLPGMRARTLVVGSFSKTYCMTGWRIGYVAGPASVLRDVAQASHLTTGGVSLIAQEAAIAALATPRAHVDAMRDAYARRACLALGILGTCRKLRVRPPEGTFYLFVDVRHCTPDSRAFARRLLDRHGVAVVPGAVFGAAGEGFVRIALTVPDDRLAEALRVFVECTESFPDDPG